MDVNKCICCGKDIESALSSVDVWESPSDALIFSVLGTYGSSFYDSIMEPEGTRIEILVCDECLNKNKDKIRKMKYTRKTIAEEVEYE